ncbi:MAG: hypothetical protein J7521_21585 [Caulobacter sp.]|nr:hypothetical protein [Caulobacter sp.]
MMLRTLAACVALASLAAGAATAAPQPRAKAGAAVAAPKAPIPYGQLDAYLKASPKQRASKDWWNGSAATGAATDTSATVPGSPAPATAPKPMPDGSVNPPPATMPDGSASMPSTPPTLPEASTPSPGSNLPGSAAPGEPVEPK